MAFHRNPEAKSFRLHPLHNRKATSHKDGSFSVSIGGKYRALFVVDDEVRIWYWIGTHSEYDTFVGK